MEQRDYSHLGYHALGLFRLSWLGYAELERAVLRAAAVRQTIQQWVAAGHLVTWWTGGKDLLEVLDTGVLLTDRTAHF